MFTSAQWASSSATEAIFPFFAAECSGTHPVYTPPAHHYNTIDARCRDPFYKQRAEKNATIQETKLTQQRILARVHYFLNPCAGCRINIKQHHTISVLPHFIWDVYVGVIGKQQFDACVVTLECCQTQGCTSPLTTQQMHGLIQRKEDFQFSTCG
jgi:hypothetical protein